MRGPFYRPFPLSGKDAVLIDESRQTPRSGRIYGLRTPDGLLVKRLRKRKGRWWADGGFTKDAEREAVRDEAPAIDLIGGIA